MSPRGKDFCGRACATSWRHEQKGPPGTISRTAAAKSRELDLELLREAAERGGISGVKRGQHWFFYEDRLDADLADLTCRAKGCDKVALGASRVCRDHVSTELLTGREASPGAVAKMAAAHRGKMLSPEHKAAISAALRTLPDHVCPQCRTTFRPRVAKQVCCDPVCKAKWAWRTGDREARREAIRRGVAHRTVAPSEQRACERCGGDLGIIVGSRLLAGRGRFHLDCWHEELRENPPEHLGGWNRAGRPVLCPGCSTTRWQRPSKQGTGWCRKCRGKLPAVLSTLAAHHREREAAVVAAQGAEGLLVSGQVEARWGRSRGHVARVASEGLLPAELRRVGFTTVRFFPAVDFERFLRSYVYGPPSQRDRYRSRRLDPGRRGAPRSDLMRDRLVALVGDMLDEERGGAGRAISRAEVLDAVAERDWRDNPGDWSRERYADLDRADSAARKKARDRVNYLVGGAIDDSLTYYTRFATRR